MQTDVIRWLLKLTYTRQTKWCGRTSGVTDSGVAILEIVSIEVCAEWNYPRSCASERSTVAPGRHQSTEHAIREPLIIQPFIPLCSLG